MSIITRQFNGFKGTLNGLIRLSSSANFSRFSCPVDFQQSVTLGTCFSQTGRHDSFADKKQFTYTYNSPLINLSRFFGHISANVLTCRSETKETDQIWSLTQKRYRWRHKLVRSPPTKPLSFDFSGDQTLSIGNVDLSEPKLGYETVEELKDANDDIKKIFSLEFDTKSGVINKLIHDLLEKVKDHPLDLQSLEVTIAKDTIIIRNGIKHCLQFRKDKITKARLIKRICRRRKMLGELKMKDIEKFNWLVSELRVSYVEPTKFDKQTQRLTRKGIRKKIARDAAMALKKQKMEEFQKKLAEEKTAFEKYRDTELAKLEAELKELGITEMKTMRDTLEALNATDLLPKPEPRISRRRLLLHKKFELYGKRKKIVDEQILHAHGFLTEKEMPYLP